MKFKKIYNDIINEYFKNNDVIVVNLGDEIFVSPTREISYFIPSDKFLLDINKFNLNHGFDGLRRMSDASDFVSKCLNQTGYEEVIDKMFVKTFDTAGVKYSSSILLTSNSCSVYVDERLLLNFNNPTFKIKNDSEYVMVYEKSEETEKYERVGCVSINKIK